MTSDPLTPPPLAHAEEPTAPPAFRVLVVCEGVFGRDRRQREAARAIHEAFESGHGRAAPMAAINLSGRAKGGIKKAGPATMAKLHAFFDGDPAPGVGVRRYGPVLEVADEPWLPFFGIEQSGGSFDIEIAVPPEPQPELAEVVGAALPDLGVACAVMGYGFWFPPRLSSLVAHIGRKAEEWPAAIAVDAATARAVAIEDFGRGLRGGDLVRWWKGPTGLADIGWRTVIGEPFRERLPDLSGLAARDGITVVDGPVVTITAAPEPVWGWAARSDQPDGDGPNGAALLENHRAVSRALRPVRAQGHEAARANFRSAASHGDEPTECQRYFDRLD